MVPGKRRGPKSRSRRQWRSSPTTADDGENGPADGDSSEQESVDSAGAGVYDESAYKMRFELNVEWPCLSFDVVRAGNASAALPAEVWIVAGTQASAPAKNSLNVLHLSRLGSTNKRGDADEDDDESDESDSSSDSAESPSDAKGAQRPATPHLDYVRIRHNGSINRVRCLPQVPHVVAAWSDQGSVGIFDIHEALRLLPPTASRTERIATTMTRSPSHRFQTGTAEGFALDWSPLSAGWLAFGDCRGRLAVAGPAASGGAAASWSAQQPLAGHDQSVEDIQWSPTEATVLASCSCDRSIRFWDTRQSGGAALTVPEAHDCDINGIAWNRIDTHLLASGDDAGGFCVWDLRMVNSQASANGAAEPAGSFRYHDAPVTALEWHPHESSVLCASSADGSVSIWDLSVERDPEEEAIALAHAGDDPAALQEWLQRLPPQLLFVHQGQVDVKEVHWHPLGDTSAFLLSTALGGLHVFKPINI
ncbi:hypothetical protein CDCA_CDCA11G3256 [Cyanidium caldarium]|uniref:Histone-binding protein RBBP4-like N-terminal domain-containing protein n=1 Tax=Cyanidium caldarium TaxID=2771 RepID=A0AAV9IYK6_CYACA|nr:hypothetical protein CDCA_CDCA11G3256 [Cyanidium caldarium]